MATYLKKNKCDNNFEELIKHWEHTSYFSIESILNFNYYNS